MHLITSDLLSVRHFTVVEVEGTMEMSEEDILGWMWKVLVCHKRMHRSEQTENVE